jgi:LCP family protein required for cell wall assembly
VDRSNGKWLAAGAAGLVLAGFAAFILLNQGDPPTPGASPLASSTAEVTPGAAFNEELLSQRLTVLLIGLDANAERRERGAGNNTDTLMLASVSADQSELLLVSLPRDTVDLPMPDGRTWDTKINALYAQEGVDTLVGVMEELYQVPIDGYALIDMDDLEELVDAVGGVDVSPPEPLVDDHLKLDIPAGDQHLDGKVAMAYVRTRVDTDYGRMARQQEMLQEVVRKLSRPRTDVDVAQLLSGLDSFETDLPLDDLPTFVEIARRARNADVTEQVLDAEFHTFEGIADDGRGYIIIPDIEAIRALIARHITDE